MRDVGGIGDEITVYGGKRICKMRKVAETGC